MREREAYRALGFVRLGDYVVERPFGGQKRPPNLVDRRSPARATRGSSYRTAQEMMRVNAALESLSLAAAAFDAGEITSGHVRLLTRVAGPGSEPFWVGLARRVGVKELARAVAAHERERDCGSVDGSGEAGTAARSDGRSAGGDEGLGAADEADLERLEIVAPAWVGGMWRDTAALIRRLAGSALPPGACLEFALAEMADAIPRDDRAGGGARPEVGGLPLSARSAGLLENDRPVHNRLLASAHPSMEDPAAAAGRQLSHEGCLESDIDARAIDVELRRLITERQRQDLLLADHLRLIARNRGYRDLGASALEQYAADWFGLSPRNLYHLLGLNRTLEALPALRSDFLAGRLTTKQTRLVGSVATSLTLEGWVRRAERVTLRRLEDEVTSWRHLKESRPAMWDLLEGGPLPEGLALVPGQPVRLSVSACPGGPQVEPSDSSKGDRGRLPGSARSEGSPISAQAFMQALEADEAATPLPERMCVIRLRVEHDVRRMWDTTVAHLRSTVRADLKEWEALALVLREFWNVWDNAETRRQRRENPTLERDGWRCAVPGCWSIGTGRLHEHHIIPRAAGGSVSAPWNVTTCCASHHVGLLHEGRMRCTGRAPDELLWQMGVEPGREPFLVFCGEEKITAAADAAAAL